MSPEFEPGDLICVKINFRFLYIISYAMQNLEFDIISFGSGILECREE